MRSLIVACVLALGAVALMSCWQRNPATCDATHACVSAELPYCDLTSFRCVASPVCSAVTCDAGGRDGFGPNDMGSCDAACIIVGPDMMPACASSSQCTAATAPVCDSTAHACRACMSSSECATKSSAAPLCNTSSGACVQCLGAMDCLSSAKACDTASGTCVPCTANTQCASGICNTATGACGDPASFVYVNAMGMSCPAGPGKGTLADPYCVLQKGLDQGVAVAKTVVVFAGTYDKVTISPAAGSSYVVSAVGVSNPTITPTTAAPAIALTLGGASAINVSLDGFSIKGANGAMGNGVLCQGSATTSATKFKIVRSTVSNNAQLGVSATACDVTLDQDVIGPANTGGGVYLSGADFTLQNLLVVGNGTAGASGSSYGGISATGTSARAYVIDSTIVNNSVRTNPAAIDGVACVAGTTLFNTVVVGNAGGGFEIDATNCAPTYSSYVGAGATNHNQDLTTCGASAMATEAALFSSPSTGDYHAKKGGAAPCSLVGLGVAMVPAPAYDLDGTTRPNPPAIGALESK